MTSTNLKFILSAVFENDLKLVDDLSGKALDPMTESDVNNVTLLNIMISITTCY